MPAKGSKRRYAAGTISKERFDRLSKLNPLFAQGGYTLHELAAKFGVTMQTIAADRDYIMENWWREEENEKVRDKRLQRVKELEQIKRLALESYHRSRQDKEEITTRYDDKICEECNGTGRLPKCKCLNCDGTGRTTEEVVTRKISGRPGDANFLAVAKSCVVEMCKIEALFKQPPVKVQHVVGGEVKVSHGLDDGRYDKVDPNIVLEAKAAVARLEEAAREMVIEGTVLSREEVCDAD